MSYIEFRDVKKTYHVGEVDIHALAGASFQVEKGEFIVVAGASGAGKSTILNILGGMDTCTSGEILVDGKRIDSLNERQLTDYRRFDIGFVFQFYNLVQNLTALENVDWQQKYARTHWIQMKFWIKLDCRIVKTTFLHSYLVVNSKE